jgi:putative ABC transport system permease protein
LVIAFPTGWYSAERWLEQFAYRIPSSWYLFLITSFIVVGVNVITISIQVIKAAFANLVTSLKNQ